MDVSIVIVNYKTVSLIVDCIRSIREHVRDIAYEVIVVDNHSGDNFQERLQAEFGDGVVCVPLPENIGFGRANNEGFKVAKGRNLFCLNPDTLLLNNAVKILSDYLDGHPEAGACGGNLYDEEMRPALSFRRMLPSVAWEVNELFNLVPEKLFYGKNRKFNSSDKPMNVGYVTGADLMLRRSVLEKVGGFSPDFFMYYEETDLCCRIRKGGFKIVSVPEAKIQHLEGKSFSEGQININRISFSERGRLIYLKRNFSQCHVDLANLVYSIFLASRIWLLKGCRKELYKAKRERFLQARKEIGV